MAYIERRGKNSFRLVVTIGYDEKGTPLRERQTVKAKNTTEAKKKLSLFEAEILTGKYVKPEKITLNKLYDEWLKNITEDVLSKRTKNEYVNVFEKRIKPLYGHMKLSEVKPIHVLNFVNGLKKDGARLDGKKGSLSTSSINNCYKAFNHILEFAKKMKWISENPGADIDTPTVHHKETEIYSTNELLKFIDYVQCLSFRWQVIITLALSSAARQSEIAALEAKHVDFQRGGIHINQALSIEKGSGVFIKDTKNKRKRFVSLPVQLMELLKRLIRIRKQEELKAGEYIEWPGHLFLFANEFGRPLRPDSISQWWGRFMKSDQFNKLNLRHIRFHDLRHSSLTYLSEKGLRSKAVQNRAGHARITTTFDIYGHGVESDEKIAAEFIGEMFKNNA
ncbi:tyrosine-type recombinase/integrase [Lentibacillus jeotgali]|uniref:tyrosine-type recombinase/integrase n=1 Tax=Lentibacillus jeotgali TaxID=558169 RepID=UPI0002628868|nr:site-specific integrase [Lentibacillus jeotgali]